MLAPLVIMSASLLLCSIGLSKEIEHTYVSFDYSRINNEIVFSAADGDLYRYDIKTRTVSRLLHTNGTKTTPAYSPDGKLIAYAAGDEETGFQIFSCSRLGANVRRLTTDNGVRDCMPSYSPDGSLIAFERANLRRPDKWGGYRWDDFDVYAMKADGTEVERVTREHYYQVHSPRFRSGSVDIIYAGIVRNQEESLFTVSRRTRNNPRIFSTEKHQEDPGGERASEVTISPSGNKITFVSDRASPYHYEIYCANVDGTESDSVNAVRASKYNHNATFGSDDKTIFFLAGTEWNAASSPIFSLWMVNVETGELKKVIGSNMLTGPTISEQQHR